LNARTPLCRRLTGRTGAIASVGLLHALALWALFAHDGLRTTAHGPVTYMTLNLDMITPASPRAARPRQQLVPAPSPATARVKPVPTQAQTSPQAPDVAAAPDTRGATNAAPTPSADPFAEAPPSPPHKLDVDALRRLAREDEHRRVPTPLQRVQDSQRLRPRGETDAARAVDSAKRDDCRSAYVSPSGAVNILLLIPLIYDTATGTGCKW
jgi:hypothetical protein